MTDIVQASSSKLDNWNDSGPWYEGIHGERIAVRLSSLDTKDAYAIVESIAAPGCATSMHLHRNEEEHFVIIASSYGIAIEERIFEVSAGASITLPKGVPHSWRNISSEPGLMVIILTPGGFEQCVQTIRNSPLEKLEAVAASYGCYLVGPPVILIAKDDIDQKHMHLTFSERPTATENCWRPLILSTRSICVCKRARRRGSSRG